MNGVLTVLGYASIAAAAAALGALPTRRSPAVPLRWLGWANAVAAGLMLGAAYSLTLDGAGVPRLEWAAGAVAGILFVHWTHAFTGTGELGLNQLHASEPDYGYRILIVDSLHGASEGVAIGVAMALDLGFGIFMAMVFAVHNVAEATVLCAVLRSGGVRPARAAALAVTTNAGQVLLAIVTYALVLAAPSLLPWSLGVAAGALVCLVLVELLPESYLEAGSPAIALLTSVAIGAIALARGLSG